MVERGWRSMTKQSEGKSSESQHWMDRAKCKDWDFKKHGDPFFPASPTEAAAADAKAVCQGCPIAADCYLYSLDKKNTREHGVFGGTVPQERLRTVRREERRRRRSESTREDAKS